MSRVPDERPSDEAIRDAEAAGHIYGLTLLARDLLAGRTPTEHDVVRTYRRAYPTGPLSERELRRRLRACVARGIFTLAPTGEAV